MIHRFHWSCRLPVSQEAAFFYHDSRGTLDRLLPPDGSAKLLRRNQSLRDGERVELRVKMFGVPTTWVSEHHTYNPPQTFSDRTLVGPVKSWNHLHRIESLDERNSVLHDELDIDFTSVPGVGAIAEKFGRAQLSRLFGYRHRVTRADLELASKMPQRKCRIAISGATGLLGQRIAQLASVLGHDVVALQRVGSVNEVHRFVPNTRDSSELIENVIPWHVESGTSKLDDWESVDVLIHLAGANIGGKRWNKSYKETLYKSRVDATRELLQNLKQNKLLPKTMVTASGAGIYPSSKDKVLRESELPGTDFLGRLAQDWESASRELCDDQSRWCAARLGMVLDPTEAALVPLLWQTKLGGAGTVGSGKMFWSWVERDDAASAFLWLALQESCSGAYNVSGIPETNQQFMQILSRVLHRPNWTWAPATIVRAVLGEMADALLLRSNRLSNERLLQSGFPMRFSSLASALEHLLMRVPAELQESHSAS